MKQAKKKELRADLQGNSSHFRMWVARLINTVSYWYENGEKKTAPNNDKGNYAIYIQQYSRHDGGILFESSIYDDENHKPFMTLQEVHDFIQRDAIDPFSEESEELRIKYLTSNDWGLSKENTKWKIEQLMECWRDLNKNIKNWLNQHGEPVPVKQNNN